MKQDIYKNYIDSIKETFNKGKKRNSFEKSETYNFTGINGLSNKEQKVFSFDEQKDISLFESLKPLSEIAGKKVKYHEAPGAHPDFAHLKQSNTFEQHYITSMFIDIKNSTGLFRKFDPATVANLTTTIQRAAIHTCWYFDGYVQRFHGDGLFVYFGGKNMTLDQSVKNAMNAASFFSYFIQNDLKNVFQEQEMESIYTRIGIDTGYEKDVIWHMAGMKDCSEITTCSLHTSLACKMQANAKSNGIMLGDNVKDNSALAVDYFSIKYNQKEDKEERYIFQIPEEKFNYTQWEFNWEKYLRKHPGIISDENGNLFFDSRTADQIEQERVSKLRQTALAINAGKAYTDNNGNINLDSSGTKNQDHRFHHED